MTEISGNTMTEHVRRELAADEAVIREAALVRNAVLRRALAIAAYERASGEGCAEQGSVYMLTWVMQASDELDDAAKPPNKGLVAWMEETSGR